MAEKFVRVSDKESDLFIAPHFIEQDAESYGLSEEEVKKSLLEYPIDWRLRHYPHFQKFIDLNAQKNNLSRSAVLCAHGGYDCQNKQWTYQLTDEEKKPVRGWINKNDGKYSVLFLYCCNSGNQKVSSKKSAILVPDTDYFGAGREDGGANLELYVPKIGYIDSYREEAQFKDLQRLVKQNGNTKTKNI